MHYQLRELVDLRKLEYDGERRLVYWHSYHDNTRTKYPVLDWKAQLAEYQWRLGQWPAKGDKSMNLHTRHGHMSERRIRATHLTVDGEVHHRQDCHCRECERWERAYPDY